MEVRTVNLVTERENPETYHTAGQAGRINRELLDIQQRRTELNPRWEQEATRLEALE